MLLRAVLRRHTVQVQGILDSRLTRHEEFPAVRSPERCSEILFSVLFEIRPDNAAAVNRGNADADRRIWLPSLRISGPVQRTILPERRIYREHRHFGIVEPVESYFLRIRRPPESTVHRRPSENLLIIHPGSISVQYEVRPVGCQACLLSCSYINDIQVIGPRKC